MVELAEGVSALSAGVAWLHASRAIVAADVHFGYEDVIGGALPSWSTAEIAASLSIAAQRMGAREIVLLGDVIHASRMSEGAARTVRQTLDMLRAAVQLTIVAGNHEGRTRGAAVLGETVEVVERDGWTLLHGDDPAKTPKSAELRRHRRIIGHLHPSLALAAGVSAPAFLASRDLVVVPAMTPYSGGLDVLSDACLHALRPFGIETRRDLHVVAAAGGLLYPFGTLSQFRGVLARMNG
jgi:metallophosphoesterase superfamily enzyme